MRRLYFILLLTLAYSTTINIPADYSTIQEGIDASSDGDTVLVAPGEYLGRTNIDKDNIILASYFLGSQDE